MRRCVAITNNIEIQATTPEYHYDKYESRDEALGYIRAIVRDEIGLLEELCEMFCDAGWKSKCEHLTEYDHITLGKPTYSLQQFCTDNGVEYSKEGLSAIGTYIRANYQYISEIFTYDLSTTEVDTAKIVTLFSNNNEYIGHIFVYEKLKQLECIGIRSSVINTLRVHLGLPNANKGVAASIISCVNQYAVDKNFESIMLAMPIGPMPYIAKKLGFNNCDVKEADKLAPKVQIKYL